MEERDRLEICHGNWGHVQAALKDPAHPPIIVVASSSPVGRKTPPQLAAGAASMFKQMGVDRAIIIESFDPAILEQNSQAIKKEGLDQAVGATLVFKNGGAPKVYPYPR